MIRHYLTFAHQAAALDAALASVPAGGTETVGWTLAECWSQEKNVLVLHFIRERTSRFVEVALDARVGYALLREEAHRARRNTMDFFGVLIGVQLRGVAIDEGERVIRMGFADGHELACFFFGGGGGNVLLIGVNGVADSFMKYSGEYDALLRPHDQPGLVEPEDLRARLIASEEPPLRALMHAVGNFGRRLATEALDRAGLAGLGALSEAGEERLDHLLETVDALYGACETARSFHLYYLPDDVVLALTRLEHLERLATRVETLSTIGDAIRAYRTAWHSFHRYAHLREHMLRKLAHERRRLERALANRMDTAAHAEQAIAWERMGKLVMANVGEIVKGSAAAVMVDWDGEPVVIALNPKLTPVENAEDLFRRARRAREASTRATGGIAKNHGMLERLATLARQVEEAGGVREVEEIEKNNRDVFGMTAEPKEKGSPERFRRFEVTGGHEVFAGKNAANNDELTVRFARPNDYWFHARGSSGSHVVLRWNDAKAKPSKDVLRQAASIAAYYSGARGAKMVPVAYTLKKHVRKPRGSHPGSVVMEREEVVMVEPRLPPGGNDE